MSPTDTLRERDRDKEQTYIIRQSKKTYEHRESQATAMSVDYTGQWVLLAGRRHLALQRLGHDDGTLRKYCRNSKYEVSAAEFASCPNRQEFCAIATSQHIDIVTWGAADPHHFYSLRGHTRMVTDIDWHSKDPNLLVSCSIDTFSHIWDLRDPRKPTLSLSAVCMSGATQVGFNRVSGNLLAAAHDGDLRIWDIRKGSCPIHYITAHLNRVHGINWSHRRETCLATASQDGTVKYFDVNNPRRAEKIITTSSPVWRARYTPIGNGLVSIVVPHLGRGENSLLLWSNSKQTDPVCSFVGHTDVILDFAWRPNRENFSEIELVTWSRDRTLRVWKIDDVMLKLCEPDYDTVTDQYELNESLAQTPTKFQTIQSTSSSTLTFRQPNYSLPTEAIDALQISARSPPLPIVQKSDSIARSLTDQPTCSLHHEFSLLNTNIPHVEVEARDAIKRFALFKITAGGHVVVLQVTFPTDYPSPNVGPDFTICQGTTISDLLSVSLLKVLKTHAMQRVKKSRTCLEQCLRALVVAMKKSVGGSDKSQLRLQSPRLEGALSGALHDACIPFPRTSAAKFNSIGMLTSFAQILSSKRLTLRHQNVTPRTLSAINGGGLLGNVMGPQPVLYAHRDSNASFYLQDRMSSKHSKNRSLQKPTNCSPIVHIYETSKVLNISRELAQDACLDKYDIIETCRKNRQLCETNGRLDLLPIWTLAETIATPNIPNETQYDMLFYKNPFKKSLLEALIIHFATAGDIQTAVLLACVFHKCAPSKSFDGFCANAASQAYHSKMPQLTPSVSPYHTVLPIDKHASLAKNNAANALQLKQLRSNSWSDSLDWIDAKVLNADCYSCSLIRKNKMPLFDHFKRRYAEILFGWQLLTKRSMILKHTMYGKPWPHGVEFVTECAGCNKLKHTPSCASCQRPVLSCALCCLPVKGAANACLGCGHGGHIEHMELWFQKYKFSRCGPTIKYPKPLNTELEAGATQVGFNRVSGNLLAAAHDGDLRIWDIRKGSCPIHYITAHLNRVHGINWSHRRETCLATASQDGTVKYFDVNNPRRAEKIITTSSPVWRARYTPIGNGLVSIVVPHLGRGENSLLLWSNSKQTDPVCSFVGHTDVILDFAWRPNRENFSEIELVTWSRDRTLRVWKIDDVMLKLCEPDYDTVTDQYELNESLAQTPTKFQTIQSTSSSTLTFRQPNYSLPTEAIDALQISARSPPLPIVQKSDSIARSLTDQPTCSLHHEFSLLNTNIPHVEVEARDAIKRFALFKITAGGHVVVLQVTFPTDYPSPNVGPDFTICQGTTISDLLSVSLLKVLKTHAMQRVKKSRTCLEQCLRALVVAMKKSVGGSDKSQLRLQSPRLEGALSGALHDACIPFPRTSAAKFNSIGMLTSFAQILSSKRLTLRHQNVTPRTLSAINGGGLLGNVMGPQPVLYAHRDSNASFYLQDRMSSKHSKNRSLQKPTNCSPIVHIYETSKVLNISRELAQDACLDKYDIIETCRKNRQLCETNGRLDLLPIWTLAETIATPNIPNETQYDMLFYKNPFKKSLLEALIIHFATAGDIQTAVLLACVFHKCAPSKSFDGFCANAASQAYHSKMPQLTPSVSPYHTVLPIDKHASLAKNNAANALQLKQLRSNSWSDSLDWIDAKVLNADCYSCSLIRKNKMPLFDHFKRRYAEILFGWQLLTKRSMILKHTMYGKPWPHGVEFVTECAGCNKLKHTPSCASCQRPVLSCALCCLPVKGAANACLGCGHGGHIEHMELWFQKHKVCATGCGCQCLQQTALLMEHIQ